MKTDGKRTKSAERTSKAATLCLDLQVIVRRNSHLLPSPAAVIFIIDTGGIIVNAGDSACLLTRMPREELVGKHYREVFLDPAPDFLERLKPETVEQQAGVIPERECRIAAKGDDPSIGRLSAVPVRHHSGPVLMCMITEIRKASEADSELPADLNEVILDNLPNLLLVLDEGGNIMFVNSAACGLFSRGKTELAWRPMLELICAEDRGSFESLLKDCRAEGPMSMRSIRLDVPGDSSPAYSTVVVKAPACGRFGGGFIVILHDPSQTMRIQQDLGYEERLHSIGLILSKITHEVRNPLAAIQASAEFLRRHWDADEESKLEVAGLIADEVNRVNNILTEFLRLRRIPRPQFAEMDVKEITEHVVKALDKYLKQRPRIKLTTQVQPFQMLLYADLTKQILWNLLNNAIEAIAELGEIRLTGRRLEESPTYELKVADNGCGMDDEQIKRAFEPFYTSKPNGTGLGLSVVKLNVESLGGTAAIESSKGRGTEITVLLPLRPGTRE
jgi:nitrogen fixation/metabolism regulation signal transduction histidine kinase